MSEPREPGSEGGVPPPAGQPPVPGPELTPAPIAAVTPEASPQVWKVPAPATEPSNPPADGVPSSVEQSTVAPASAAPVPESAPDPGETPATPETATQPERERSEAYAEFAVAIERVKEMFERTRREVQAESEKYRLFSTISFGEYGPRRLTESKFYEEHGYRGFLEVCRGGAAAMRQFPSSLRQEQFRTLVGSMERLITLADKVDPSTEQGRAELSAALAAVAELEIAHTESLDNFETLVNRISRLLEKRLIRAPMLLWPERDEHRREAVFGPNDILQQPNFLWQQYQELAERHQQVRAAIASETGLSA